MKFSIYNIKHVTCNIKQLSNKMKTFVTCYMLHVKSRGFSLIELLVVISIILVFSGITLASYNTYTQEQKLDSAARKILDVIDLAKKKISSGDVSTGCTGDLHAYAIKKLSTNKSFEMRIICSGSDTVIQSYILSSDNSVQFESMQVPGQYSISTFRFLSVTSGVETADSLGNYTTLASNDTIQIVLKNIIASKCFTIIINSAGTVSSAQKTVCS